jgi:flagellar biosynthesis protein FlhB
VADDDKTEEPTAKRLSDTLEKQGGPSSREVGNAAGLLVITVFLAAGATKLAGELARQLASFIEDPGGWRLEDGEDAVALFQLTGASVLGFLGLLVAALTIAAIASSVLQTTPRLIFNRISPDFSRVSPLAGFGRLISPKSFIELLKGTLKIGVAAFAVYAAIGGAQTAFVAVHSTPDAIPEMIRQLCLRVALACTLFTCVIAVADVFFTRREWTRNLMMTKQEIKEEMKQAEGDVAFKARLRGIARARLRRRMMANIRKATVVVTNPTHYAVALRYVRNEDEAPKVLAKGQDHLAKKIREIAASHSIPIVENKTLARALYDTAEVDELIPREFYKAVAEIIIYLESRTRKPKPGAGRTRPPGAPPGG